MPRRLYHLADCPQCNKVRLALALEGLNYESREIDPDDRAEVERISGQPKVPVLVAEDGSVLFQANRILQRIASVPGSRLLPLGRRDQALTWVLVERADTILAPLCHCLSQGQDPQGRPISADDRRVLELRLADELGVMEGLLERGPFLFGERPTVADVSNHAFLSRLAAEQRRSWDREFVRVAGWYERVLQAAPGPGPMRSAKEPA